MGHHPIEDNPIIFSQISEEVNWNGRVPRGLLRVVRSSTFETLKKTKEILKDLNNLKFEWQGHSSLAMIEEMKKHQEDNASNTVSLVISNLETMASSENLPPKHQAELLTTCTEICGDAGMRSMKTNYLWKAHTLMEEELPIWKETKQAIFNRLLSHLIFEENFYKLAIDLMEPYLETCFNEMVNSYLEGNDEADQAGPRTLLRRTAWSSVTGGRDSNAFHKHLEINHKERKGDL